MYTRVSEGAGAPLGSSDRRDEAVDALYERAVDGRCVEADRFEAVDGVSKASSGGT